MFFHYSFNLKLASCYEFQACYRLATWLTKQKFILFQNLSQRVPSEVS